MAGEPVPRTITASTLAIATGAPLAWLRLVSGRSELTTCPTQFRIPHLERTYGESRETWPSAARKFVPSGYRAAYEFLGTWAIAIDHGVGSSEIHNVYGRLARSPRTTKAAISPMERY